MQSISKFLSFDSGMTSGYSSSRKGIQKKSSSSSSNLLSSNRISISSTELGNQIVNMSMTWKKTIGSVDDQHVEQQKDHHSSSTTEVSAQASEHEATSTTEQEISSSTLQVIHDLFDQRFLEHQLDNMHLK